jgi:6,7-dimethyl-8-ribityllumazine synthase
MSDARPNLQYDFSAGILFPKDACVVIVRTRWNAAIVDALENGCQKILVQAGITIKTFDVPGAFEISFAIRKHAEISKDKPLAYIALGCVLRGDTPHFDYVCNAVTDGIVHLNQSLDMPVIYGILTVDNEQQAIERIGGKHGHKGEEAATTALEMIQLIRSF